MLRKLAVKRLTKLADFMHSLPRSADKHFDMKVFFNHTGGHEIDDPANALAKMDCGTKACALGWATSIPEFRKAGLVLQIDGAYGDVLFHGSQGGDRLASAMEFFKLSVGDAFVLFGSNEDEDSKRAKPITTPKQWAKHCRKFIKTNT